MKTVSILQYDHDGHQFFPSFVIQDDLKDCDFECSLDELVIQPSEQWMEEYLQWNRFGRLPDDPCEDSPLSALDEDDLMTAIPVFDSLQELHAFNAKGDDLTKRLQRELEERCCARYKHCFRVAPFKPLYYNMAVGPVAAWWHVKDLNYNFVVPVQRLPVSDVLKSRLQTFRCHKGMGMWNNNESLHDLMKEGQDLQRDLTRELHEGLSTTRTKDDNTSSDDGSAVSFHSTSNARDDNEDPAVHSEHSDHRAPSSPQLPSARTLSIKQRIEEVHVCN